MRQMSRCDGGCEEVWCTRDLSLLSMGHADVASASYLRIAGSGDGAITVARVEALLSPAHWGSLAAECGLTAWKARQWDCTE